MRKTDIRVLILVPRYYGAPDDEYRKYILPLGLAYISSVLKQGGYKVDILNLNAVDGIVDEIVRDVLSKSEYSFILTGGLSAHFSAVQNCIDSVRRHAPSARIILGGGLASSAPEIMFNTLQPDYMIIGEGEESVPELLECLANDGDLSKVDGIVYCRSDRKLAFTKPRTEIRDINLLPWPDYEGLNLNSLLKKIRPDTLYYYDLFDDPRPYPIIASRSCPYSCTFCYHPIGKIYRQRSISNIIDEIGFAIDKYNINIIEFYDELFSHDRKRLFDICEQLKQLFRSVRWEVKWTCQMRVYPIDEELLRTMKDAGCYLISFGLESYSSTVLKSMGKNITPQQIDNALRITHRLQMTITGNFIFGDVAETAETAYETLNYWKKNYHTLLRGAVALGFIGVYPGTALYKHCLKKGIITDEIDFIKNHLYEPINMTDNMSDEELEQLRIDIDDAIEKYQKLQIPSRSRIIDGVYELHVKCPYCNVISGYKNFVPPSEDSYRKKAICCRNCRMRFFVVSLFYKLYVLVHRIIGTKNDRFLNFMRAFYRIFRGSKLSVQYHK